MEQKVNSAAAAGWPTRYTVVLLAASAVFICYMDRVIISVAIIPMAADFDWSPEQQGRVLSSFFVGYLLTQVAGGWLAERYGGKIVLGVGVVFWSVFTLLTPVAAAGGMIALLVTRVLMGVGEGITFPSIYALFGRWVPLAERSRAIGMLFSLIPLGSVFALLATPWIVARFGWEAAFYAFGSIGFVWWIFWQRNAAPVPEDHQRMTPEELTLIRGAQAEEAAPTKPPTMMELLRTPAVWAIIVCHFCANWGGYVLLAWMPTYINKGLGVDFASVGIFTMIPSVFAFLALNAGGWTADRMIGAGMDVTRVRKIMQTIGFGGLALILATVGYVQSVPLAIAMMSLGNIFGGAMAGGFGVNHLDIAPRGAGVIMGLSNTAATIPGIIGVYVSGLILEATGSWAIVFQTAAGVYVFGLVFYLIFASSRKLFD
ncbi:MAG: ACS family MFS transporter [Gammaproteobacteria bacterium]|nr:ACS family MFS transporter [Gammaproteobacteria bacterium]